MILKRLQLQGAKGIKYGLGLDYVDIDFTRFQPGLVAIIGRNGRGKTTILENLTPFRSLFSRSGKLQNHFIGSDAFRKLTFQIENDTYESELYIDPEKDKITTTLKKNNEPIATKPRDYDEKIDELFLSKVLFEQSLFFGQDSDRISDLRAGEAKEFMITLLQLDKAQEVSKRAGMYTKQFLGECQAHDEKIDTLEEQITQRENMNKELKEKSFDYDKTKTEITTEQEQLDSMQIKLTKAVEDKKKAADLQGRKRECEDNRGTWRHKVLGEEAAYKETERECDVYAINTELTMARNTFKGMAVTLTQVKRVDALNVEKSQLQNKESKGLKRANDLDADITSIRARKLTEKGHIEKDLSSTQAKLKNSQKASEKIKEVPCDENLGEECSLLTSAFEARGDIKDLEESQRVLEERLEGLPQKYDVSELETRKEKATRILDEVQNNIRRINTELEEQHTIKEEWELKQEAEAQIKTLEAKLDKSDALIKEGTKRFHDFMELAEKELDTINKKKIKIQQELDGLEDVDVEQIENEITAKKLSISTLRSIQEITLSNIGQLKQKLADANIAESSLKKLRKVKRVSLQNYKDWRTIEGAFSRNGMQAFEIKEALPAIVKMMNELLIGELGQKFSLNFRMKRIGGEGQLIDTFDPLVTRYSDEAIIEKEVPLEHLSRGERILVFVAMSEAVGVYLRNSIGLDLRTAFVDEADGPLDPVNRKDYLMTRKHVHDICNLHHTFIISQSPDIYERIPQQIKLLKNELEIVI